MINCILIQWLNEQKTNFIVINWNAVLENPTVVGLAPDLEYCVKRTPFPIPEYDPRLTNLVTIQNLGDYDTEYPQLLQWITTYELQDRTIEEKKISVEESEADANFGVFPTNKHLKLLALSVAIIDRKASGLTINATQQAILDLLQDKAQRIWNNHVTAQNKKAELDANNPVDLDTDWETIDPENEA